MRSRRHHNTSGIRQIARGRCADQVEQIAKRMGVVFVATNFKVKPYRDKRYLEWIRSQPCAGCGWPAHLGNIDAHHVETGGTSTKCGDDITVPLCNANARGCHPKADKTPDSVKKYLPLAKSYFARYRTGVSA